MDSFKSCLCKEDQHEKESGLLNVFLFVQKRMVWVHIFIFFCDPFFFFSNFSAFTDNLILIMQNQNKLNIQITLI